jgi:tRNA(Ile)-lysidine synthase TilS/MesJ
MVSGFWQTKLQGDSLCAFCSRMKRGLLYTCCQEGGYNKLVLAQHLDDLVESLFMSLMHNGQVGLVEPLGSSPCGLLITSVHAAAEDDEGEL